jgi:hypothetical protein
VHTNESALVRHLALAVALKLIVLAALWWGFVRDERVDVDASRAAAHIATRSPSNGEKP